LENFLGIGHIPPLSDSFPSGKGHPSPYLTPSASLHPDLSYATGEAWHTLTVIKRDDFLTGRRRVLRGPLA